MIGQTISHYQILGKLGEGGMGVVYKARDTHLDRFVALKVLPPEKVADPERKRRFVQEAKAASALNHPNIITIYDIDTSGGVDFIAMEYVEGQTLSRLISRRPLPLEQALDYGVQIASALAAAHRAGITHRDLKPGNVMVTGPEGSGHPGLVKVLDFGLAKLTEAGVPGEDQPTRTLQQQTEEGALLGTVAYMSPEQAEGKPVDSRSDIFSFGVLLYEMVSGRRAFERDSKLSTLSAILREEPKPLGGDVPPELDRIVSRCLRKDPNRRSQHMGDVKVALEELREESVSAKLAAPATPAARRRPWLWGAPVLAVLVAALAWWGLSAWRQRVSERAPAGRIESIAVLPLANLSGDPAQEYFADGMTEALISDLAQIGALRVISRTSVMQFKGTRKALPEIARELKVDAVLEGSVLRAGNRVRISAQLIEGATDRHLWAQNYERDLTDVLALQGEVARAVAGQIQVRLTPREQTRLAKARPVKPEAYEYYLRGIHLGSVSKSEVQVAIGMLERAAEIDPGFAVAHAYLAQLCAWMVFFYAPEEQAQWEPRAYGAVDKALALDPDLAEAYVARGQLLWTPSNHFPHEKAIREFRRALALKPNSSDAHGWLAGVYNHVGLLEEGLRHSRQALAIDPSYRPARTQEMLALVGLGRYEDALSLWQGLPQRGSGELIAYVSALAGRLSEARAKLPDLLKEKPEDPGGFLNLLQALLFAADGKQQEAEEQIQKVVRKKKAFGHFHHTAFGIACAYARMHKPQKAMDWLEQAADGYPCYPVFQRDPNLDSLRKEPRFIAFLERVKKESDYYKALVSNTE